MQHSMLAPRGVTEQKLNNCKPSPIQQSRNCFWLNYGNTVGAFSALTLLVGGRKGIRRVRTEWCATWYWRDCLSVFSEVQIICIWSSWCHCHPIISCSSKTQNGLPFWFRLNSAYQVVLEKRPLNGCSSSSSSSNDDTVITNLTVQKLDGAQNTKEISNF